MALFFRSHFFILCVIINAPIHPFFFVSVMFSFQLNAHSKNARLHMCRQILWQEYLNELTLIFQFECNFQQVFFCHVFVFIQYSCEISVIISHLVHFPPFRTSLVFVEKLFWLWHNVCAVSCLYKHTLDLCMSIVAGCIVTRPRGEKLLLFTFAKSLNQKSCYESFLS